LFKQKLTLLYVSTYSVNALRNFHNNRRRWKSPSRCWLCKWLIDQYPNSFHKWNTNKQVLKKSYRLL